MTLLYWYVLVGLPAILLLGAYGAVRLADHDAKMADEAAAKKNRIEKP